MHEPDEQHRYVAGYTVDSDPYVQPNGVLTNLLNLDNTADLNKAEAEFVPHPYCRTLETPRCGAISSIPSGKGTGVRSKSSSAHWQNM